ncbi:putative leucine-rich repeat domain superfamily [Plasmopara halstedii]
MQPQSGICHLQHLLPIDVWEGHLIHFLTLNEAGMIAELSRFFYDVVHNSVQIQIEASLPVTFQPVGDDTESGRLYESIHYNVDATGNLIVDVERNETIREPDFRSPSINRFTDANGGGKRFTCPQTLQNCIQSSDAQVKRLNLSGVVCLSLFDGVNCLQELGLSGCSQVDGLHWLKGIREVDMSYCSFLDDVTFLSDSQHVNLSYCHNITNVTSLAMCESVQLNACRGIIDVSSLSRVRCLSLRNCPEVSDVSALGNVYDLDLGGCENVTDVSALGKVYLLNLSGCINVTDVSALGQVHTLKLLKCTGIVDVSALGLVKSLDLSGCINVTDVNIIGQVASINLALCDDVTDISAVSNGVQRLSLRKIDKLTSLSTLALISSLRELNLSSCTKFSTSELRHLPPLHRLVIAQCTQLTSLDGIRWVCELDVSFCNNLQTLGSSLRGLDSIVAYRCEKLSNIEVLTESTHHIPKANRSRCCHIGDKTSPFKIQEVDLRFCVALEDVHPLAENIRTVKLAGCSRLVDASPLARVYDLDLSYCQNIEDVSALGAVHKLSLRSCPNVRDVSALTNVHTLDVSGCMQLEDSTGAFHC